MPSTITPDQARKLLKPHVGAKLRGDYSAAVDIRTAGHQVRNADIRCLTEFGITRFVNSRTELLPWNEIVGLTIAALDDSPAMRGMGVRLSERTFDVAALKAAA